MVSVRVQFTGGPIDWLADEARWQVSRGEMPAALHQSKPNLAEWESFWLDHIARHAIIDARDLCFDGLVTRSIDWAFRGKRWVCLRGRGFSRLCIPPHYFAIGFEEGWVLHDAILDRIVFLVAAYIGPGPDDADAIGRIPTSGRASVRSAAGRFR